MKVFLTFLHLEIKKSIKVMMHSVFSMIMVSVLFVGGIFLVGHTMYQSQIFNTINVGIVIPDDASELQMISQVISSMDSIKSICRFEYMSQDQALEELESGEIQAVISLPESLYQDIYTGQSTEVTVYFPKDTTLSVDVFREVLHDGVKMLQTAEAGVFASRDVSELYETDMDIYEVAQFISFAYIQCAFERGDIFIESVLLPFGEMNLKQYYVAVGLSVLLLMSGIGFAYLYPKQGWIIEQKLRVNGLGSISVSVIKVFIMMIYIWLLACSSYLFLIIFGNITGFIQIWWDIRVILFLLILSMATAVAFHAIYSIVGNGEQGSVLLLCINILLSICSGVIIPAVYLPDLLTNISSYMPINFMNQFCAELLFGTVNGSMIWKIIVWIAVVFLVGVVATWANISHGIRFSLKRG